MENIVLNLNQVSYKEADQAVEQYYNINSEIIENIEGWDEKATSKVNSNTYEIYTKYNKNNDTYNLKVISI